MWRVAVAQRFSVAGNRLEWLLQVLLRLRLRRGPAQPLGEFCFPHFDHLSADFLRVFGSVLQVEDAYPAIVGLLE